MASVQRLTGYLEARSERRAREPRGSDTSLIATWLLARGEESVFIEITDDRVVTYGPGAQEGAQAFTSEREMLAIVTALEARVLSAGWVAIGLDVDRRQSRGRRGGTSNRRSAVHAPPNYAAPRSATWLFTKGNDSIFVSRLAAPPRLLIVGPAGSREVRCARDDDQLNAVQAMLERDLRRNGWSYDAAPSTDRRRRQDGRSVGPGGAEGASLN